MTEFDQELIRFIREEYPKRFAAYLADTTGNTPPPPSSQELLELYAQMKGTGIPP